MAAARRPRSMQLSPSPTVRASPAADATAPEPIGAPLDSASIRSVSGLMVMAATKGFLLLPIFLAPQVNQRAMRRPFPGAQFGLPAGQQLGGEGGVLAVEPD